MSFRLKLCEMVMYQDQNVLQSTQVQSSMPNKDFFSQKCEKEAMESMSSMNIHFINKLKSGAFEYPKLT